MAAISQTTFLNAFSWKQIIFYSIFTEICPIDAQSALVQVLAGLFGAKPLREPKFTDACMRH